MSELDWAAGFFEGEGCFTASPDKRNRHGYPVPQAVVGNTDLECLTRFQASVGMGNIGAPIIRRNGKPMYYWRLYRRNDLRKFVNMMWDNLSSRRQARACSILVGEMEPDLLVVGQRA